MNYEHIKAAVAAAAGRLGAEAWEIDIDSQESAAAEALKDEISTVSYSLAGNMTVRCVVGGKSGYAGSQLVTAQEAEALTEQAYANALAVDEADPIGLFAGSERYETAEEQAAPLPSAEELKERALRLQRLTYAADEQVVDGTQCGVSGLRLRNALINSKGLDLNYETSLVYRVVQAGLKVAGEAVDSFAVRPDGDRTDEALAKEAVHAALAKAGAGEVDSGKYRVILNKECVRNLLSTFSSVFSARSAYLKTTLLVGKEGQSVAAPCVTLLDDPFHPQKFDRCPYDGEGVAAATKAVIEGGVLKTLLYNRLYADLMGAQTTGNSAGGKQIAPKGLHFAPGKLSEEALLARLGSGLYITSLQGLHAGANTQSGDFSLQAEGFLVVDGKKTGAVKNFTVADNFFRLLQKIEAVADAVEFGAGSSYGGTELLIPEVSISGK